MPEREHVEECPQCGTEMYTHGTPAFWCDTCELEYHREGDNWYRTDLNGNTRLVTTDGEMHE